MSAVERTPLFDAAKLADWFDGFVGSEEERAVADALIHVVVAAEQVADPALHPADLHRRADPAIASWASETAGAALAELREALE